MPRLLVLASTSPFRRDLLARLQIPFEVAAPDTDEAALPGEPPAETARRLAEAKARAAGIADLEIVVDTREKYAYRA